MPSLSLEFLTPNDARPHPRPRQNQTPPPPSPHPKPTSPSPQPQRQQSRRRSPLPLFLAGLTFTTFSLLLTRRTLRRRRLQPVLANPPSTSPSSIPSNHLPHQQNLTTTPPLPRTVHDAPPPRLANAAHDAAAAAAAAAAAQEVSPTIEALEALSLASINVASFALLGVGGGLWWFDIRSMEEFRGRMRKEMGVLGDSAEEADREMEEWVAAVLSRRDEKERGRGREEDRVV